MADSTIPPDNHGHNINNNHVQHQTHKEKLDHESTNINIKTKKINQIKSENNNQAIAQKKNL